MKYKVITPSFYCTVLERAFIKDSIVEIKDKNRAKELLDANLIKAIKSNKKGEENA